MIREAFAYPVSHTGHRSQYCGFSKPVLRSLLTTGGGPGLSFGLTLPLTLPSNLKGRARHFLRAKASFEDDGAQGD